MRAIGWAPRFRAFVVAGLFLGMMLSMFVTPAMNVTAGATIYTSDSDAYLAFYGPSYPPYTNQEVDDVVWLYVGQFWLNPTYAIHRSFVSFNTSGLPDDAVVQSAWLDLKCMVDMSVTDFDVRVYSTDYGASLTTADWNATGALQGTLMNTAGAALDNWYGMYLSTSAIDTTGWSQFMLNSSRDGSIVPTGYEFVAFYSGNNTGSEPKLTITYILAGTPLYMELTTGSWLNTTIFPEISEWNLTYDLYYFSIDTVPDALNVTIEKEDANWTFRGVVPGVNLTEDSTMLRLEDVYDSICYRVWFTVPKTNPYSTIHLSLYNTFTGEGFFWEQFRVQLCEGSSWDNTTAETIARPDFSVEPESSYVIRVLDYFGNALTDYTFVSSAQDIFISLPIPVYSWQIFNMNDAPVLMRIYWNNSGSPWEFFVGPHWIIERFLKGGDYSFMVTFYESSGIAGETVYFNRTVPMTGLNASFIYVNGTTLSEIVSSVEGVMAVQEIITSLVSPSVIVIYEDLPLAPVKLRSLSMSASIAIDPYLILEATTYQNQTGTALADTSLWLPHPDSLGCTYYIIADTLTFSGTYLTEIYVNDTDGNNLYSSNVLPAALVLGGQNLTVWGNNSYSVSRATTFREISEYTVNYYSTQRKYEAVVSLNNSCSFDYYSPYWYIAFPGNTTIDQDTVTLYDLDNDIYLSQRTNFDVTAGGIHVTLNKLNSSNARNFRLTYWDENGTTGIGAPNLIAEAYSQGTLNGVSMKYTAVQWANPWSVAYSGEVYVTLNFTNGDNLLRSSITLIDETTGNVIPNSQYVYTGRTILILTDGVGTVGVGGARNYGIYFTFDAGEVEDRQDFFFGPIIYQGQSFYLAGYAISWALILIVIGWCLVAWRYWTDERHHDAFMFFVIWGSCTLILAYFSSVM